MTKAKIAKALPTHINAYIVVPTSAPMLTSVYDCRTFRIMINITVAMTLAAVMNKAARKVKIVIIIASHLLNTDSGVTNINTNERQAPVRNRANIQCEATSMILRIDVSSEGSLTSTG